MAAVIDLVSSDEEDDPGTQTRPSFPSSSRPVGSSPSLQVAKIENLDNMERLASKGKVEKDEEMHWGELSHPEEADQRGVGVASCSTSDPARDSVGVETERRPKMQDGGRGKRAQAGSNPSSEAQDTSLCRHFWGAGDYEVQPKLKRNRTPQGAMDHVRVHPKFLHSNATSHKWALGAIAELLDNSIDEIQNGATFVSVDKITNARDGNPALLVQDDGGGMSPDDIRQCMSLGYSRKTTNSTIGQYGNGFKTSTMRLGADVIVFTRHSSGKVVTQSIGLLSYTFLRKTGHEDIVVPMVDYQLSPNGREPTVLVRSNMEDWLSNLSTIIKWSPYSSEVDLLRQFDNIGWHGTKVVVFNLWLNDDGIPELDFEVNKNDIQLRVGTKEEKQGKQHNLQAQLAKEHISNRYRLSLRVYASILYLSMPPDFRILLRGLPVEHHSIAMDLKFTEYIVYKPQIGTSKDATNKEASVITTIGFTKEAPMVNVHGFNVYHKNRLIMPFWKVFQDNSSRGRGVVGVLEANFIEPAHDKQDFERTAVFLRLESRLKSMTIEYWNLHCQLIGYQRSIRTKPGPAQPQQPTPLSTATPELLQQVPPSIAHPVSTPMATSSSPTSSSSSYQPIITHENNVNRHTATTSASTPTAPAMDGDVLGKVKLEENGEGLKRTLSHKQGSSKRQRTEADPLAPAAQGTRPDGLGGREDGGSMVPSDNNSMMVEVLEQNTILRLKCTELEQKEKDWQQKVAALERELLEQKIKYTELVEQIGTLPAIGMNGSEMNNALAGAELVLAKEEPMDMVFVPNI